jgi:hypothetical protein
MGSNTGRTREDAEKNFDAPLPGVEMPDEKQQDRVVLTEKHWLGKVQTPKERRLGTAGAG